MDRIQHFSISNANFGLKIRFTPFFLLFLFFFLSCSNNLSDFSRIKITEVIDGDTLVLEGGIHLRLIGIDTPEVRRKAKTGFIYDPAPFSIEAKEFTKRLAEGKSARIEFDIEKKDKYNRTLGYCFVQEGNYEIFLNKELLNKGFAVLYTYPPNIKYVEEFVIAQRQARENKEGLWGIYEVVESYRAKEFIGQIRTVKGKVMSTYNSGKTIFLNFGSNFKTDFTVAIFKNSFGYFHNKGIRPEIFYKGKTIQVSGRIREYNGPEIIANSPLEIEILE